MKTYTGETLLAFVSAVVEMKGYGKEAVLPLLSGDGGTKFIRKKLAEYSQTGLESTHQCTPSARQLGSISCVTTSSAGI